MADRYPEQTLTISGKPAYFPDVVAECPSFTWRAGEIAVDIFAGRSLQIPRVLDVAMLWCLCVIKLRRTTVALVFRRVPMLSPRLMRVEVRFKVTQLGIASKAQFSTGLCEI